MTDSYSNFNDNCHLLETSMASLLWLTIIVTETPVTVCPEQEVFLVLLVPPLPK